MAIFAFFLLRLPAATATATCAEIPFEFREGLLWIKATVRQSGESLNLLVDTGAGVSVLNTSAAERLGLKQGRPIALSCARRGPPKTQFVLCPARRWPARSGLFSRSCRPN